MYGVEWYERGQLRREVRNKPTCDVVDEVMGLVQSGAGMESWPERADKRGVGDGGATEGQREAVVGSWAVPKA